MKKEITPAEYLRANAKFIKVNYSLAVKGDLFWGINGKAVNLEPSEYLANTCANITKWNGGNYSDNFNQLLNVISKN